MQAAVDFATVARVWQFMRDARFVDTSSRSLRFQVAVLNSQAHTAAFWDMRISMLESGRLEARASIVSAPTFSARTFWNPRDLVSVFTHTVMLLIALIHTLHVSGVWCCAHQVSGTAAPSGSGATANGSSHSRWFRLLCQITCAGLCATLVSSLLSNVAVVRRTSSYALAQARDVPPAEFLPVHMYHDLLAPARILLPARQGGRGAVEGVCDVVSDGSRDPLDIRAQDDRGPLWAQESDDNGTLDNLISLLVRVLAPRLNLRKIVLLVCSRVAARLKV